jgi:hypothetical protein
VASAKHHGATSVAGLWDSFESYVMAARGACKLVHEAQFKLSSAIQTFDCLLCTAMQAAIISPHLYPPTITGSTFLGAALWAQSNTAFAYLQQIGFCQPFGRSNRRVGCYPFPVLVGETGSAFKTSTDKQWLNDFADYMNGQVRRQCHCCMPSLEHACRFAFFQPSYHLLKAAVLLSAILTASNLHASMLIALAHRIAIKMTRSDRCCLMAETSPLFRIFCYGRAMMGSSALLWLHLTVNGCCACAG